MNKTKKIKSIIYNKENTLMVHSFSSNILPGDNISINIDNILDISNGNKLKNSFKKLLKKNNIKTITFDDGLYQQIPFIKLFKDYKVIIFPSGNFIREDNTKPIIVENSIAHKQYHATKTYPNTFMSSIEIWDLLYEKIEFGMHGWYHYNLNPKHLLEHIGTNNFRQILNTLKNDAEKCSKLYIEYIKREPTLFIKNGILNINYCTPYNCLNEYQKIYIDFFYEFILKEIDQIQDPSKISNINEIQIIVYSNERISLEYFIEKFKGENYAIM